MASKRANYEAQLVHNYSKSNNYKIFRYISSLKGHTDLLAEMCYGDQTATDGLEKARLFNEYFFSVFLKDQNSWFTCPSNNNILLLHDIETSTIEVYEILSTLDVTKAPGIDGISPAVLRHFIKTLKLVVLPKG